MHYNRPRSTATWGLNAKDWEAGVDYNKLRNDRLDRAQTACGDAGFGAFLCFNFDNIRYITGTHIGEWGRDKFDRYCLCPNDSAPFLWDPASPAKRKSSPWLGNRVDAPVSTMQGAIPPEHGIQNVFAKQIKEKMVELGIEKQPLGIDVMELPMLRALEAEKINVVDGQQALMNAREVKTEEEIELLKVACAMVDAAYLDIAKGIRPGAKESDLVAIANEKLYAMGSERVECVNSVSGPRGAPHSHTFSDRMIQPGDMIFLDIMNTYNGYKTCYYRTFICGQPNEAQNKAYEICSNWVSAAIDAIKPGGKLDDIASLWPRAEEFGYANEDEAFLLQFGHGVGLSLWERPIISRRYMGQKTELKKGMVFAVECWKGADDGSGAARIEEEVVVTEDGCEIITNFPSDHLISCGLPGCEIY